MVKLTDAEKVAVDLKLAKEIGSCAPPGIAELCGGTNGVCNTFNLTKFVIRNCTCNTGFVGRFCEISKAEADV